LLLARVTAHLEAQEREESAFTTGILNLFELVHVLTRGGQHRAAEIAYDALVPVSENLTRRRIFDASRLRARLQGRGLSYADAAGYVTAREIGATFVTTDRGFRGLPGVKIVEA
jgi:predicted nucleic acid-binding protein